MNLVHTMHRIYLGLIICIFLSACSSTRPPLEAPVDSGYVLHINQPFQALPNGTHIDFQHGVRVASGNLDRWTTYCRLYVYNRHRGADYRTEVSPGEIGIGPIMMISESSDNEGYPWKHHQQFFRGVRDLPAYYLYQVRIRLTSPDQPDIHSLSCYKKWATPRARQYPTLAEIREALGELMELTATSGD